jgi:hypothetical protein
MSNRRHGAAAGVADVAMLAAGLRRVGKGASHVLVGPALVYRDDTLSMMVIVGSPGGAGRLELSPSEWCRRPPRLRRAAAPQTRLAEARRS